MKLLEERIRNDAKILKGDILKVDSFLNHQIDVKLLEEIGKEFYNLFKDSDPDKILTIETSGIAIATFTSRYFDYIPVVYAKKGHASNMDKDIYLAKDHSYTRNIDYDIQVAKEYLNVNERVLLLDDFLANGEAMNALIGICNKAKARIVGCGAVISKTYQPGEKRIKDLGYDIKSLARIKYMDEKGNIEFE